MNLREISDYQFYLQFVKRIIDVHFWLEDSFTYHDVNFFEQHFFLSNLIDD